jgi:transcriptional regulator with XRE-family HTH domain
MVGAELRRVRTEKGLALEDAARAMKLSKYRLCKIEHGMYASFDLRHLYGISALYGVSPMEILSIVPDSMFQNITL